MTSSVRFACFALPVLVLLGGRPAMATLPLAEGELVVTCGPSVLDPTPWTLFAVGVIDARDPDCAAGAVLGENWVPPMYHNEMPNPTGLSSDVWTIENLGFVFGVALDDAVPPNIYVTSTTVYRTAIGDGTVHRLDGVSGAISVFAVLPNSGQGLGNIAFDAVHGQFFVTNHEDGGLYRLDRTGATVEILDPFMPDTGAPGFAPLGERLWGVGIHGTRVYFGVWQEDGGRPSVALANTVWSVALDPSGGFIPADLTLEVAMPTLPGAPPFGTFSSPVSDIAFSKEGRMLLAERTMAADTGASFHASRVLEYDGGHLAWAPSGATFQIGAITSIARHNSAGGVAYDCVTEDRCNSVNRVWATGDALIFRDTAVPPVYVYGVQGLPETGGDVPDSYLIDLDADTASIDKTGVGDVEVYRTCLSPPPVCGRPPIVIPTAAEVHCEGEGFLLDATAIGCVGATEYRWLDGASEICPWSTTSTCPVAAAVGAAIYTVEVRCADDHICAASAYITVIADPVPLPELAPLARTCAGEAIILDASASERGLCPSGLEYRFLDGATELRGWDPAPTFGPLIPAGATTYTVEVRCGECMATVSVPVDVDPFPIAALSPLEIVCAGGGVMLDASGSDPNGCPVPLEYRFLDGASELRGWGPASTHGPVLPSASGSYRVEVRCGDCTSETTAPVVVVPMPTAVAGDDVAACELDRVVLDASASTGGAGCPSGLLYEWWQGATRVAGPGTDPTFVPSTVFAGSTTYRVVVRCPDAPECETSDELDVHVRGCTFSVDFTRLQAVPVTRGVEIRWTTGIETGTRAFQVEGSSSASGTFVPVGAPVRALGSGASYMLSDPAGGRGSWYRVAELTDGGDRGNVSPPFVVTASRLDAEGSSRRGRTRQRRER